MLIGGGSAALFAAEQLSANCEVHIYEKGKTIGRKFLVAGNGGFNLTNSATGNDLYQQYTPHPILQTALKAFDSKAMRFWLEKIGIPTFVGSSGRIFPQKGIKPIHVLQKIKNRLIERGVTIHCLHQFIGFDNAYRPIVTHQKQSFSLEADAYIFALGGASWSVTGANSLWLHFFEDIDIQSQNFEASNCGVEIEWSDSFKELYQGTPLKNVQIGIGQKIIKGEALITKYGLEGNAIYPIVPIVRNLLKNEQPTSIILDLKPYNSHQSLLAKIKGRSLKTKNYAYAFNLNKAQIALIKQFTSKSVYLTPKRFIEAIKHLEVPIQALRPIEEAISTVGGISLDALNLDFSFKQQSNLFAIGEMLDWDAPTGGFLLQGCFSTAAACAHHLLH